MNETRYLLAANADTVAKFVARHAKWHLAYELYKADNANGLPKHIAKDAKWPAYEAAHRIETTLGLETHASSVPELATTLAAAIEYLNKNA